MNVKSGLVALSILSLVTIYARIITSNDEVIEAYRWVEQSNVSAIVIVVVAVVGLIAALTGKFGLGFLAGGIALAGALVQLLQLNGGGIIGGGGSTFALLLGIGIGFVGLATADRMAGVHAGTSPRPHEHKAAR